MGLIFFDIQQALRGLARTGRYVWTLALVVGLTLGAAAVLLVQVYSVRFTHLPAEERGKLVVVHSESNPGGMLELYELSAYARNQNYFDALTPYVNRASAMQLEDQVLVVTAAAVQSTFFELLNAVPLRGRQLLPEDDQAGAAPTAIISHRLWMTEFHGQDDVLGNAFVIDGRPIEIVGIMPEGFHYPQNQDLWLNLYSHQTSVGSGAYALGLGLLSGDETIAADTLSDIKRDLHAQYPGVYGKDRILVERLVTWSATGLQTQVLFMTVVLVAVLLIGGLCTINLMASRFFGRSGQWRLRSLLGGSPQGVITLLLVEALVVFSIGLLLAYVVFQAVIYLAADYLVIHNYFVQPFWWHANLSAPVLAVLSGFVVLVVGVTTLGFFLFGIYFFRLSESRASRMSHRSMRFTRWGYAFLQVGLTTFLVSFFLLASASYYGQITRDLGFDTENILVARLNSGENSVQSFDIEDLVDVLESVPGVLGVSFSDSMPAEGSFRVRQYTNLHDSSTQAEPGFLNHMSVTPGFFDVLGIRLAEGRLFGSADYEQSAAPQLGVMDVKTSMKLSAGSSMLGHGVSLRRQVPGASDDVVPVIGVVSDVKYDEGSMSNDIIFVPLAPFINRTGLLLQARTEGNPLSYVNSLEDRLQSYSVDFSLTEPKTVQQMMMERGRGSASLMLNFLPAVLLAVVMCAIGIVDVAKRLVHGSRRDIGICMAMGMTSEKVLLKYLRPGLLCIGAGLLAGAVLFLAARPVIVEQLIDNSSHYTLALTIALLFTAILAALAVVLPLISTLRRQSVAELIR